MTGEGRRFRALLFAAGLTACSGPLGEETCGTPSEPKAVARDPLPIRATPAILPDPAAPAGDGYGYSVALSGDTLVIGAPLDAEQGKAAGAVHVLTWDGSSWVEEAKLLAADGHELQKFGWGVATEGDTIAVSAEGVGYFFVRQAPGGAWRQQAKIVPADAPSPLFRLHAVAGDLALAGDTSQRPYVFQRRNDRWSVQARLESGGSPVGLEGDTAILRGWRLVGGIPDVTALNVYTRTCSSWVHQTDLTPDDGTVLGAGVAFEGDTAAVQASPDPLLLLPDRIHVFRRSGAAWALEDTITSLTAFSLGGHLAVAGDRMVASEMVTETRISQARIFTRVGTSWTDAGSLVPTSPQDAGHTLAIRGIALNDRHVAITTEIAPDATHPAERRWVFVY